MTKRLLNLGHPMTKRSRNVLRKMIGEFGETKVHVQLDMESDLIPQLDQIVERCGTASGYIILPDCSPAAGYIINKLSVGYSDATEPRRPKIIVIKRVLNQFLPDQII